jgi:hypothetical protein
VNGTPTISARRTCSATPSREAARTRVTSDGLAVYFQASRCHSLDCPVHGTPRIGWPIPDDPYDDVAIYAVREARRRLGVDPWRALRAISEAMRRREPVAT